MLNKQNFDFSDYLQIPSQEAYRVLSANLGLNKKTLKVISIISFNPGEGKTTVAINLAIAEAKSGARVLYVAADLLSAATGSDLILLGVNHKEFASIDFRAVATVMRNKNLLDTRNFLNGNELERLGFRYYLLGKDLDTKTER